MSTSRNHLAIDVFCVGLLQASQATGMPHMAMASAQGTVGTVTVPALHEGVGGCRLHVGGENQRLF